MAVLTGGIPCSHDERPDLAGIGRRSARHCTRLHHPTRLAERLRF